MTNNQRRFSRVPFDSICHIVSGDMRLQAPLIDISLKGVLVHRPPQADFSVGQTCNLEIDLGESGMTIRLSGTLTHVAEDRLGFQLVNIDLDSMIHLRRLMELNMGDASLVERELLAML